MIGFCGCCMAAWALPPSSAKFYNKLGEACLMMAAHLSLSLPPWLSLSVSASCTPPPACLLVLNCWRSMQTHMHAGLQQQ